VLLLEAEEIFQNFYHLISWATFVAMHNIVIAQYSSFNVSQWQVSKGEDGVDLTRIA
jgi:uncharacterized protein with HEPN domain